MEIFDLKLGFSCNNDCLHCVITSKKSFKDLSTEEIKKIICNQKTNNFTFTGGEPTIRKDFIELISFASKLGKNITLQTNGRAFLDDSLAKESSKYISSYVIAIHSYDEKIHDTITSRENSWKETTEGIKNLNKYNADIYSQTVISKLNAYDLVKTYDYIYKELNIKKMNLTFPHPNGNAYKNFDIVVPKYSEIHDSIVDVLRHHKWNLFIESIPLCYLHPNIDVKTSSNKGCKSRGYDASLSSMNCIAEDYDELTASEKRKPVSCKQCIYDSECDGVWKEYYYKYLNELDLFPIKKEVL